MTDDTLPAAAADTGAVAPTPPSQPAQADANPFAAAAGQVMHADRQTSATQIRNNLVSTSGQNPDQAAQYQHLAKYVGVPLETVQAQPDAIKQQAALQQMDTDKLTSSYPTLSKYLTVPDNMAKSHDDIAPLAAVEGAVKALPGPTAANAAPTFGDDVMANVRGLADVPGELAKGLGGAFNKAAGAVNIVAGAVPTLYDKAASLITGQPTTAMSDAYFKSMVDPLLANQAQFAAGKDAPFVAKAANTGGALLGALAQITLTGGGGAAAAPAESVAGVVGQAAEHGAKSMAFPALTDAVSTAHDVYQQTGDAGAALRAAQGQYLATTSAGIVPLSAPGGLLTRLAGGAVSGAVSGEANRQMMNMVLPATMAQPFDMESLVLSGLAGAGLGAVMGPHAEPSYMDAVRSANADATKAAQAEQGAQGLQALGELASASKTRERDPAGFRDLVQNMTEDSNLQDVYVDANKFAEVLSQSNVTIEQLAKTMPDVAAQFQEAVHTNGDIRIPVEDYATHIAGGPVDAALLPHLKTDPDGFTYQQGQEYFANQQTEMRAQADQLGAAKEADDKTAAEAQVVHDKVLDQLNATGRFQPAVNNAYAALTRDFYSTMAERAGSTPAELYARFPLKITGEALTGEGLDQGERGSFNPETNTIGLLKAADLSTYLHESGHFFLETMHSIAGADGAPEGVKGDFDTLLKSFGVAGDTPEARLADWSARGIDAKRDGHEQFARGFEAYLMEGKAPTLALQGAFSRFRSWLVNIYKSLLSLNVQLTPEVRGVMDRMIASDEAIRQAEQARAYFPLTAPPDGTTAEQFAAYQNLGKEATDQALADMTARSIRDIKWLSNAKSKALRGLQKEAAGARKEVLDEVTKEVNAEPVNQARASLKKGKLIGPDGQEQADSRPLGSPKLKLRKADVDALYPESMLNRPDLEPLKGLSAKEGLDPDIVADMFGYPDGRALLDDLLHGENAKDKIEGMTDQRMLEQHGELSDPVSIERAAEAAIHNDARARFVATGLKLLSKSPVSASALAKAAKEAAEASIAAKRVRDLRPAQHAAAEARANKDAIKLAPKDPAGAVQAQRAALLNNRLFKAASEAVAEVTKGVDYLKKFDKPAVREKLALDYRDQIDTLLDRFDLRKSTTLTALDGRESLLNFVERMAAQGNEPQVPEALLNEAQTTHYKDMTVEAFRGLLDAVKSIETMGRKAQMVADGAEMREIAALADEARETMAALPQRDAESNRGLSRIDAAYLAVKSSGRSLQASLLKMEQMMDWLDNRNPNGVLNRVVFRRIADAGVHEADLQKTVKGEIDKLVESHLADITKDKGVFVADGLIDGLTGKPQRFTKKEMLALAGNMGNDSNLSKLLAGEKWSETAVWDFLNKNMKKADWDFVSGLGRTLETLWPEKLAMSRRLGNTNPEKIAPRPFDTPHGTYEGWYWPLAYDPARSQDVAERGARAGDELFENIYSRANTDTGRMNTRNENYARPLLLSLDVIPRIIKDEIHDVAYREAIIDADKFLSNSVVRKGIVSALSQEHYDQLRPWLQSIANDRKVDMQALKWFDALAHGARTRATIVGLGYRLSTILVHGSSAALESVAEVGPVWFAKGLADFSNPAKWGEGKAFVFARSGEMRNRMNEVDRDVREHIREIDTRMMDTTTSAIQRGSDLLKAHAYQGIAMLDMASALPTWMGAYHKAMDPAGLNMSEQDAIYFADKTVRNAHGGTGVKDMAAIQRGPEFLKLFTMFYTFWNHNINRLMDTARLAGDAETWKDGSKAANVIMKFLIYTLGIQTLHSIVHPSKDDEGDTNWLKWAGKEFTSAAFSGIPVLRDLAAHYISGKDYSATPAAGMVDTIGQSGVDAANALTGKDANPKVLKHTITTAGYVFGLPTGQAAASGQFLWDVSQGAQDPQDIGDWYRGMLHGDMNTH